MDEKDKRGFLYMKIDAAQTGRPPRPRPEQPEIAAMLFIKALPLLLQCDSMR